MATTHTTMQPKQKDRFTSKLRDYYILTKPEVNLLILMTTSAGSQLGGYMTNPNTTFLNGALCNDAPINDEAVSDSFVSNPPLISQGKHVSTGCRGGAMLDESKLGGLSPESVKRQRERSNGRQKLKNTASGANGSHHQSHASSTDNSLSNPEPESLPIGLQKKSKEATASDNTSVVEVDASTNEITLKRPVFGTNNEDSNLGLAQQVVGFVPTVAGKLDSRNLKWVLTTLREIGPKDELERLLAVQMVGIHLLAIECVRRASVEGQTAVVVDANINHATKLTRTYTAQMEALNRHRGKVGQQMVVGNVNVNEGGQAIVGPVSRNGPGKAPSEDDADKSK
jgi:hypothetical protein